ncbi:leucine-rich repeat protein [Holdemanella porci]|uniref:leucine-rich repeat protein n=1 Tax=Holdemanella porci TaxID=2652276 RepID=UPI003F938CB9
MKKLIFSILLCLCMVLLHLPMTAKAMEIYVDVNITGVAAFTLEAESGDSITGVKEKIHAETGYPVTQQILMFDNELLKDDHTLADYNIQKESTLVLSLAVPEGLRYSSSDNEVTITGYTGSAAEIAIPHTIESNPVTAIETKAFKGSTSLTSVTIPEGVTSIGERAFENCSSLKSVTIPSSVTSIIQYAFCNCTSLTSINIPTSVTSIEEATFFGCSSLISITIPSGVTSIEKSAFSGCSNLKSITIPNSVTSIGNFVFSSCTSLESVTIPNSVMSIGKRAFAGCSSLKSVDILDGVTSIGEGAFENCSSLESVTIPNSVTSIGLLVFKNCMSLKSVTIPSSVTSIGQYAFWNCTSLTSVTIPSSVTSIGQYAFWNCTSLTSVTIPNSVTIIGNYAFRNCKSLESIVLPKGLDLTSANIPNTTSQVKYSLDTEKGKVTITEIALGTGKTGFAIPATICGYPVAAVIESEQNKVGEHLHVGTATCKTEGTCTICGNPYILSHDFSADKITAEALKTAGTCQTEAEYYYSCAVCNLVEKDDNHTFMGTKDSDNHTGGTEIRGAKDATCTEEGYTGDTYCIGCGEKISAGIAIKMSAHNLEKIPAKDATVTETGNKEYWQCENCKKYFADEKDTNEISLEDTVIQKLPPEIIKGKGQCVAEGEKKALSFTSNAAYSDFIRVELDGKTLDAKNYTVKEGSTVVTLKSDYVATLSAGKHAIGIVSESGTATTTFIVNAKAVVDNDTKSPQTGDNSHMALWIALLFVSGAGVIGTTVYGKKKRAK